MVKTEVAKLYIFMDTNFSNLLSLNKW